MNERTAVQTQTPTRPAITPAAKGVLQRQCACGQHTAAGGECEECKEKREATLQRAAVSPSSVHEVPPIVHEVLRSPGQPLDVATRAFMEPRFGHDFSGVRVHTSEKAAESARAVNALAYTVGQDVVFGARQYQPATTDGRNLVAHELTHVVQQGTRWMGGDLSMDDPDSHAEQEARLTAHSLHHIAGATAPSLARSTAQLQRAECSLGHLNTECAGAASACAGAAGYCSSRYPDTAAVDRLWNDKETSARGQSGDRPNASRNLLHFLDTSGSELVMPTNVFETHRATQTALMRHRDRFLEGARRRLESGLLAPGATSEEIVWTDTTSAFSIAGFDDLGLAVGGYTLCSKVHVRAAALGGNRYEITFVDWSVQAFDCYNWDPGKGIGVADASDNDMCCLENAGRGRHFRIRTDVWANTHSPSLVNATITATLPAAAPSAGRVSTGGGGSTDAGTGGTPPSSSSPGIFDRVRQFFLGR